MKGYATNAIVQFDQTNQEAEYVAGVAMSKPCRHCESLQHTGFMCPNTARTTLKTYKPMNKIGKVQKRTQIAVAKWKRTQEPNHQGYYTCYMCGKWIDYLEAEHVKSKARNPELRTDLNNLKPTCSSCNSKKGSKNEQ